MQKFTKIKAAVQLTGRQYLLNAGFNSPSASECLPKLKYVVLRFIRSLTSATSIALKNTHRTQLWDIGTYFIKRGASFYMYMYSFVTPATWKIHTIPKVCRNWKNTKAISSKSQFLWYCSYMYCSYWQTSIMGQHILWSCIWNFRQCPDSLRNSYMKCTFCHLPLAW